jgi:DNA-binding PadR family transcriptional regulator
MAIQPTSPDPAHFVPLKSQDYFILFVLVDADCHGYRMIQEIARLSGGQIRMEAGNLYRSIRRLTRDGLVAESDRRPAPESDDERRRYYRITDLGRRVFAEETARMRAAVAAADARSGAGDEEAIR